ncbi:gamma-glutamyltransferase family protein [Paenibacillus koleovorans]|uniref:gamma-glutamyltransferase family protein n=1 Tax=Paenibacillus koleovorans TaxID=121608 RepID=UPI000FD6DA74|nr:gamma-glutamyltransferase family protein [Paenibacillus koleovorans]
MNFDSQYYPYPSRRTAVYGRRGMVATSQPLAAQAGLEMLRQGGNAIDAAIATAASLTVLEPTSNGIGGDAFALVWTGGKLHGLNASGPAPAGISIEALRERGYASMPKYGIIPVTVPGAPAAWVELSRKFGKLPFEELLKPAIRYAEEGYPISATLQFLFGYEFDKFDAMPKGPEFDGLYKTFLREGRRPKAGEVWRFPEHAATLRSIAATRGESFYRGELAERIDAYVREHGGYLTRDDLAAYKPEWVEPVGTSYRGYDVWEIPPNGHGMVALLALNILKRWEFDRGSRDTAETQHRQIEAMKLAFVDGMHYITDPAHMKVSVEDLLSEAYATERAGLIGEEALYPGPGTPPRGGTVYMAAADEEGNMVSFIQSNYMGFGSGVVVEGTGIALQNRGGDFSLDSSHSNALVGGKKSYHTIIPGFLSKDGEAVGCFGVMGGYMQPQGHVQMVMNTIDFGLNPQAALDAPRWQWKEGKTVEVEPGYPDHLAQALSRRGHTIVRAAHPFGFGRGQIIWRDPESGVLIGGTEPRTDGHIAVW